MTGTKKLAAAVATSALATTLQATLPVVSNVAMQQIPHTRKVQITYDLADADAIVTLAIETNGVAIPDAAVTWLSGDINKVVASGNAKRIEWNAGADWPENVSDDTKARVTACSLDNPPAVVVVDLSEGSGASTYPVSWYPSTDALPGGVTNSIYKDSSLVLKRIKRGYFTMGESTSTVSATLTNDFYMGVYQLTQGQWYNVMGSTRKAYFTDKTDGPFRPMEQVSYEDIRGTADGGYDWPNDGHAVLTTSFMGALRARTGGLIEFDLPTEAQWEYACRAGTTTYYSDGLGTPGNTASNAQMDVLGRYAYNGGRTWNGTEWNNASESSDANYGTAIVGSYLPNPWGLYDVHGNVYEFCLDWYADSLAGGLEPLGPESGLVRVRRGGSWAHGASNSRLAVRNNIAPSSRGSPYGFRVAAAASLTLEQ